uniref:Uncharacterized protein n=1 Tax=Romanomermis culicivorax TaxID=13658 RepID=A0A915JC57_ROMCU
MSSSSRQEEQLKTRFDETKKIMETIKSLAKKKAANEMIIESPNLEEYIVEKLGFGAEPNFDAENPFDGPKIDDENEKPPLCEIVFSKTAQKPEFSGKSCYFIDSKLTARTLSPGIRGRKFHEDGTTTIGEALDRYWGAENEENFEKQETMYARRVEIIVKIRSLHEPSHHGKACWWCSGRKNSSLSTFAFFSGEKARLTCTNCKRKFLHSFVYIFIDIFLTYNDEKFKHVGLHKN